MQVMEFGKRKELQNESHWVLRLDCINNVYLTSKLNIDS